MIFSKNFFIFIILHFYVVSLSIFFFRFDLLKQFLDPTQIQNRLLYRNKTNLLSNSCQRLYQLK